MSERSSDRRSDNIWVIALTVLAVVGGLYVARSWLVPVMLALFISAILSPMVRGLRSVGLPEPLSAMLILTAFVAVVGYGVYLLAEPTREWINRVPEVFTQVERKVRPLRKPVEAFQRATRKVESMTSLSERKVQKVELKGPGLASTIVGSTQRLFVQGASVVVLLYFLLASRGAFTRKIAQILPTEGSRMQAVDIVRGIERDLSRYLLVTTAINLSLGVAVAIAMWLLGLPNPMLWGGLATLLHFIPYIGAAVSLSVTTAVALVSLDSLSHAMLVPAVYLGIAVIEGNFVTPYLLGRSLRLSAVVLLIGLMFWSWLWGIVGALLAVPILVSTKIVCERVSALNPIAVLLGK